VKREVKIKCLFCGKGRRQVRTILVPKKRSKGGICNECVALCVEALIAPRTP